MSKNSTPTASVETITPGEAHTLLATKENHADRRVTADYVTRLADDMRLGFWTMNGESIKLNKDGVVIDGQHRLHACIAADKSITTLVVRGLSADEAVQFTTDNGRKRSMADALRIRGEPYVYTSSGAVAWQWRFLTGMMLSTRGPSVPVGLKLYDRFAGSQDGPGFRHSARVVALLRAKDGFPIPLAMATWCHFVFGETQRRIDDGDGLRSDAFMEGLFLGVDLPEGDPRLALRKRFTDHASPLKAKANLGRTEAVAVTIKGWNDWLESTVRTTNRSIYWRQTGPAAEAFPEITGQDTLDDWFRIRLH